jgi:hypothetical protein
LKLSFASLLYRLCFSSLSAFKIEAKLCFSWSYFQD